MSNFVNDPAVTAVFDDIYANKRWGGGENPSGPGATFDYAARFAEQLSRLLEEVQPRTFVDAGCGSFHWMQRVRIPSSTLYVGVDAAREVVDRNRRLHGSPTRSFVCADYTKSELPESEVLLCRYSLQHLPWRMACAAMGGFMRTTRMLLATTFPGTSGAVDCELGGLALHDLSRFLGLPQEVMVEQADPMHPTQCVGVWRFCP